MKNLVFLALVASGCTTTTSVCGDGFLDPGEQCDDGNNVSGDGCSAVCTLETGAPAITANWKITNLAKQTLNCPSGFDTAALYSQEIDTNFNDVGSPVIDLFNCTNFTGVSGPLKATTYYSWISIANTNNSAQYASSTSAFVDLTNTDKSYNADILTDGGYFQLQWALQKNGVGTTCAAQSQVAGVESISTDTANSNNFASDIFPCADHLGITSGFSAGTYTVSVDALNSSNAAVSQAVNLTNKTIQAPNKVTDLGTVTIPLD